MEKNKKLQAEVNQREEDRQRWETEREQYTEKVGRLERELQNIYSSRGWKYLTKIKRIFGK